MELVPGGDLARKMAGAPWPIATAAHLLRDLALAVHHAHRQNVIHRDLNPANVLFHLDGTPRITDFGLAKQLDSDFNLTDTGRILGTARYMAPEQAAGQVRAIGPATDIHALGVILYELLTGRHVFAGSSLVETLEQVRSHEPVSPTAFRPDVPGELAGLCLRCLHKDPAQRFQTAEELAGALRPLLAEGPALPPAARPQPGTGQASRSQWWRV
jgi:serine/threonine protein kinase